MLAWTPGRALALGTLGCLTLTAHAEGLPPREVRPFQTVMETIKEGPNQVRVTVMAPDVVRIRIGPNGRFINDGNPEYSVVLGSIPVVPVSSRETQAGRIIETGSLRLEFTRSPLTVAISDAALRPLISDWRIDFSRTEVAFALDPAEHLYGFGDKRGPLDKRGQSLDIWNTDAYASTGNDSYKNIPFYMSTRGYGLYLHNWWRSRFDLGATNPGRIVISAAGGEMDLYVFLGPSLKHMVRSYTRLTGRPALQPLWFWGYHQGKASYHTQEDGRRVARELRRRKLPCDVIYYDDLGTGELAEPFVHEMRDKWNMRLTYGLGMPSSTVGTTEYAAFAGRNVFLVKDDGTELTYDNDETEETVSTIDFFSPAAAGLVFDTVWKPMLDHGGECGMIDFGELTYVPDPAHVWFPSIHRTVAEMHNAYSLVFAESLINRAARHGNGHRKVGMVRSGTAGSQRVGWTTTGDSKPTWADFRAHLRGLLCLTLSGYSSVGFDIGGWDAKGANRLYARWFEAGMFLPFAWAHGQGDHEPWVHGPAVEKICRAALDRRYRLLPYLYSLNDEASRTGVPAMRTLVMETGEELTAGVDDEWFLGPWLLVAPVLTEGTSRDIVLPSGDWTAWDTGKTFRGPAKVKAYPAPLDIIPVFVRAGAIIPMGPAVQYAGEKPLNPLTLAIWPGGTTSFTVYEDDAESLAFEHGDYVTTRVECMVDAAGVSVTVGARDRHAGGVRPGTPRHRPRDPRPRHLGQPG